MIQYGLRIDVFGTFHLFSQICFAILLQLLLYYKQFHRSQLSALLNFVVFSVSDKETYKFCYVIALHGIEIVL